MQSPKTSNVAGQLPKEVGDCDPCTTGPQLNLDWEVECHEAVIVMGLLSLENRSLIQLDARDVMRRFVRQYGSKTNQSTNQHHTPCIRLQYYNAHSNSNTK